MAFKQRYHQDEEFRKKHLAYIQTKTQCECSCWITRCNMTKHKQSQKHFKNMNSIENNLQKEIEMLKAKINEIESKNII